MESWGESSLGKDSCCSLELRPPWPGLQRPWSTSSTTAAHQTGSGERPSHRAQPGGTTAGLGQSSPLPLGWGSPCVSPSKYQDTQSVPQGGQNFKETLALITHVSLGEKLNFF